MLGFLYTMWALSICGVWGASLAEHRLSCSAACGILVPQPEIEPVLLKVEVKNLLHWTAREVPR